MDEHDARVIACNFAEATSSAKKGALAYVQWPNWGGGNDRIPLLIRSRGGRWIEKWEAMHRLTNFRFKTIPPEHPLYGRMLYGHPPYRISERDLELIQAACAREHLIRVAHSSSE